MSDTVFTQRIQLVYPENNDAVRYMYGMVCAQAINQNLYFRVGDMNDTGFWQTASGPITVNLALLYYDTSTEDIQVVYSDDGSTQTTATVVTKVSAGLWKWATVSFDLQGAHQIWQNFNNADFYLTCTGDMIVAAVMLIATDYDAEVMWTAQPLLAHVLLHEPYIADLTNATHTHANAAGGGQLDWDNVWTDAVHTHASNAEGGQLDWDTAWVDAVHSHASNAEGGQLDWDTAWVDAVHSHASNAEGGQLDWDNVWTDAVHSHASDAEGGALTIKTVIGGHGEVAGIAAGNTNYGAPFGSFYGTVSRAQQVIPMAGSLKNLYVRMTTAQPGTGSLVFTILINGAASIISVTFSSGAAAGTRSDTSHIEAVAAGDTIVLEVVNNAAGTSGSIAGWTIELDTST